MKRNMLADIADGMLRDGFLEETDLATLRRLEDAGERTGALQTLQALHRLAVTERERELEKLEDVARWIVRLTTTPAALSDLLKAAGRDVPIAIVARWTQEQRAAVEQWAICSLNNVKAEVPSWLLERGQ